MTLATSLLAQAFVALRAEDPEALSALAVARAQVESGTDLLALRRLRLFELAGALPEGDALAELLHRSTRFYNPARERCAVRLRERDPAPAESGEWLALVVERGAERREAAERWWRNETGARVAVSEAVVWAMRFAPGVDARAAAESLVVTRDRRHGLLANPQFQDWSILPAPAVPLGWISATRSTPAPPERRRPRR